MAPIRTEPIEYPDLFEIEGIAISLSKIIDLDDVFLPGLCYRFLFDKFRTEEFGHYSTHVVPDEDIDSAAAADHDAKRLLVRASLHTSGLNGDAHPLMTLRHEAVHVLLGHKGIRKKIPGLNIRRIANGDEKYDEWLTNRVAGAMAMPLAVADQNSCHCEDDLVRVFGVTPLAAKSRMPQIKEMRRLAARKDKASSTRFWRALHDYERKTGSQLQIVQKEDLRRREAANARGYMLKACPECGRSIGFIDGTNIRCDFCQKLDLEGALPVSLPSK